MANTPQQRQSRHRTRWTVRAADRLSASLITVGGIGTIVAVSAVCVFLVVVTIPLFLPGDAEPTGSIDLPRSSADSPARSSDETIGVATDEYRVMGWVLSRSGALRVFRLDTAELLADEQLFDGAEVTAWSISNDASSFAVAFRDGSVQLGHIEFVTDFPAPAALPAGFVAPGENQSTTVQGGVVERTPEGPLRRQRLRTELLPAIPDLSDTTIVRLDHLENDGESLLALFNARGELRVRRVEKTENLMTGEVDYDTRGGDVQTPYTGRERDFPDYLTVSTAGTTVYLLWNDGRLARFDTRDVRAPAMQGTAQLVKGEQSITTFSMLLGGETLLLGDAAGTVTGWFEYDPGGTESFAMTDAHVYPGHGAPVTSIAASERSRMFAVGYADGRVRLFQATSEARIAEITLPRGGDVEALSITPKNDGFVCLSNGRLYVYRLDSGHPEATLAALFLPVWYESYPEPAHVWQSSSGTDDFEPKLGMWPLVFGTLKATFYSMLFGVPLALLAAIYTSEFLPRSSRSRVKTLIESMASLPSVVLGFLAALVFAPFVQRIVPASIVGFVTVPISFLLGAYLWQLLPHHWTLRMNRFRLLFILALLPVGLGVAGMLGPMIERVFFANDLKSWLDGQVGSGTGGWLILYLPLTALVAVLLASRVAGPWFRAYASRSTREQVALIDLVRFATVAVIAFCVALAAAALTNALGFDPRGSHSFLGTYVQRNALIVGFVMGFAVIPIIYTIAEDALSAVPDHLRAASLGAGATQWQTAIRIVLPAAMSGLFSAIMIGLGRAVGETMIVLMAAGNTPILDMNIFNGFRTLSANIAVELPEAVRNSTHYRTLFLAALLLFAMTFSINTFAEMVRLRFRKRSSQI